MSAAVADRNLRRPLGYRNPDGPAAGSTFSRSWARAGRNLPAADSSAPGAEKRKQTGFFDVAERFAMNLRPEGEVSVRGRSVMAVPTATSWSIRSAVWRGNRDVLACALTSKLPLKVPSEPSSLRGLEGAP